MGMGDMWPKVFVFTYRQAARIGKLHVAGGVGSMPVLRIPLFGMIWGLAFRLTSYGILAHGAICQ